MQIRIVQSSFKGTGSTVLVNILYGIFCNKNASVIQGNFDWKPNKNINVIKTHRTNFRKWVKNTPLKFFTYVITSDRDGYKQILPNKKRKRLVRIPYNVLVTGDEQNIARNVYNILRKKILNLPDEETAVKNSGERLKNMNERYLQIKDKNFHFIDPKYQIHGSHRARKSCKDKINPRSS